MHRIYHLKHREEYKAKLEKQILWVREYKLEMGCKFCGYNKNPTALEFDHIDPSKKTYDVARISSSKITSDDKIKEEIAKCQLLCVNCHREKTYPQHNK